MQMNLCKFQVSENNNNLIIVNQSWKFKISRIKFLNEYFLTINRKNDY